MCVIFDGFISILEITGAKVRFANKPERLIGLQAAHSHTSQLWPKGPFHWDSPQQKACPHCAMQHTGELR